MKKHDHDLACQLYTGGVTTRYEESIDFMRELDQLHDRIPKALAKCKKDRADRILKWARSNMKLIQTDAIDIEALRSSMDALQELERVMWNASEALNALKRRYLSIEQQYMADRSLSLESDS